MNIESNTVEISTQPAMVGLQYVMPFLSHQITCIWNGLDVIYEITGISLKNNPHNPIKCMSLNDNPVQSEIYLKLTDLKLILRPLTDLTKEIELNGKKIIPIIELAKICFYVENLNGFITKENCILTTKTEYGNSWHAKFNIPCYMDKKQTYEFWCFESGHSTLEFRFNQFVHGKEHGHALNHVSEMIAKCYEFHLDINFLIKKGCAIPYLQ